MKLKSVEITNFRSIKYADISFEPKCLVLVGINEAGKSNVLKALSTLGPKYALTKRDIRVPAPDEDKPKISSVRFRFDLTHPEIARLQVEIKNDIHFRDDVSIATRQGRTFDVYAFAAARSAGLLDVNIATLKKCQVFGRLKKTGRLRPAG